MEIDDKKCHLLLHEKWILSLFISEERYWLIGISTKTQHVSKTVKWYPARDIFNFDVVYCYGTYVFY